MVPLETVAMLLMLSSHKILIQTPHPVVPAAAMLRQHIPKLTRLRPQFPPPSPRLPTASRRSSRHREQGNTSEDGSLSSDSESGEPLECPNVLSGGAPRKGKKRSLRSRLLRHLAGKKAASYIERRNKSRSSSHQVK